MGTGDSTRLGAKGTKGPKGTKGALVFALAAATLASSLAACSSQSQQSSAANAVAACQRKPAGVQLQPRSANAGPGGIRWSALLDRCQGTPIGQWGAAADFTGEAGIAAPGDRLVLVLDGVVRMYDEHTGALAWQRTVVSPRLEPEVQDIEASGAVVLVSLQPSGGPARDTFLDAANGQPLGRMNVAPPGTPFLVGSHVVLSDASTMLAGYDPGTGRTLWRDSVPDAPQAQAAVHDESTVYVDSVKPSGSGDETDEGAILRIDAATGGKLPSLRLSRRLNVDLETIDANGFGQGLLVLDVNSAAPVKGTGGEIGYPVTQTVAVNPRTGQTAWTHGGNVNAEPAGAFDNEDGTAHTYTAVNPQTGKTLWAIRYQGLGTVAGPNPLMAQPGYMVASSNSATAPASGSVIGVRPDSDGGGEQAWNSPALAYPVFVAASQDTVFVTTCTQPAGTSAANLCAARQLVAVAV
jgi:hypothetical protein